MIQDGFAASWHALLCDSLHTRKLGNYDIVDLRLIDSKKPTSVEADQDSEDIKY